MLLRFERPGPTKYKITGSAKIGIYNKNTRGFSTFSNLITGCIDVNRMYRISDRVIAIQMAIDGADFIEVFFFFLKEKTRQKDKRSKMLKSFSGGVLSGGVPFTKDMVYLDGLVRVHNFFKSSFFAW